MYLERKILEGSLQIPNMIGTARSHYKVIEKIGQGGMSEVYRAEDTNLDRDVAIKVLLKQFTQDLQRLARFEREAKLLAALNHPNIAAIHSFEHGEIGPGGSGWLATASTQDSDVDLGSPCLAGSKGAPTKLLARWVAILALGIMFGCAFELVNETNALSNLKRYQVATSLYQVEEGEGKYGTMSELYEADQGVIEQALYDAWDGNPDPKPLSGYLFSEIVHDTDGEPLDFRERAGLCAYPVGPGKIGDDILCVFADSRKFKPEPIPEEGFVSHGEEWTFYRSSYRDIGGPLRRFPSDSELQTTFVPFSKRIFE